MAARGSWMLRHSPLGSAEKAGGLWVLDFITSLPSRFCFFNHVLSVRIQPVLPPVLAWASSSCCFLILLLGCEDRAGRTQGGRGLLCFLGAQQRLPWSVQHRLRSGRAVMFPRLSPRSWGGSSYSPVCTLRGDTCSCPLS